MTEFLHHLHSMRFDAGIGLLLLMLAGFAVALWVVGRRRRSQRRGIRVRITDD